MRAIKLGWNAVPAEARQAIIDVFDSGQFSPGPKVGEFEHEFAKRHSAKYGVFVNSGTDALRLSLLAMREKYRLGYNQRVLVPSVTFVATLNAILQAEFIPQLVDVDPITYTINPDLLVTDINRQAVAIVPVHLFGQSCDSRVYELGIPVIEDSCETILNPLKGAVSCHSTYMAHHLTTGVGGFALTNDEEMHGLIRSFANHGRDALYIPGVHGLIQATGKERLKRRFSFERKGYSCRATEFEAALGLSQLALLQENVKKRREVGKKIFAAMARMLMFQPPFISKDHTLMMYPIVIQDSKIDKYDLCLHLEQNGIETRDMMPILSQPCFQGYIKSDYPVALNLEKNGFYIPCHPGMGDEDVQQIKDAFTSYLKK
jgi:dTDP-4-amino-4,6-dideoxygalactose transaminase